MKKLIELQYGILALVLMNSFSLRAGITFTNIFSFNGTNGSVPGILVRAGNNKFYGITEEGGPNYAGLASPDYGCIYSFTYDGVFSNLCFFENRNGSYGSYFTAGADGNFYGTTEDTIFKLNPDGTMANPNLAPAIGSTTFPLGMLQDREGTLYGTTEFGGPSDYGTIYKLDTNGVFSTIVTFNGPNGTQPSWLLLGTDNNFYGVTHSGGNDFSSGSYSGDGTIFRVDRSGNLTNVFLFSITNGEEPACLVQGADGDLYGTTAMGGANNAGTLFCITTNGALVWSFSFNGTNGYFALGLTTANDGNFYGFTAAGGSGYDGTPRSGAGTIFRITPNGSFTSLFQFDCTNDSGPSTIIQGTDGNLYGTCGSGGAFGLGAIFKLSLPTCPTNRLMPIIVTSFYGTNGEQPLGGLVQGSDGMLYGTTASSDVALGGGAFAGGPGTIFRTTLNGSLTTLVTFNGTNGDFPSTPPVQAADGNFYGATYYGGNGYEGAINSGYGTIYRMDTNGVLTNLFFFNQTNGNGPGAFGGLIVGNDGALYGITQQGGPNLTNVNNGDGTIFKITTNGDFTPLASFNGTNGFEPVDIIQASDGNFYGTTWYGGIDDSNGDGTVFRMTPDGQITTLFRFNGTNGDGPASLMQASDGCLYGTAVAGGQYFNAGVSSGYGTVFKITTNGDFTLLASFDSTNGAHVSEGLTEVCDGVFYGTALQGGKNSSGTLFRVTSNGNLTLLFSFGPTAPSVEPAIPFYPTSGLIKASDGNYYGTAEGIYGSVYSIRPVQAPVLQPIAQAGQLNLNWNAWAGYSYNLMYETNLSASNWNLLSTVAPQTNGLTSYSDPIGPDAQRFYRVVLQLP
jgi:uncharacterized repeat protein (TIGR03803 family)